MKRLLIAFALVGCTHAKPPPKPPEPIVWEKGLEFLAPMPELAGISLEMSEAEFVRFIKGRDVRVLLARDPEMHSYHVYTRSGENAVVMFDKVEPRGIQRLMPDPLSAKNKWRPGLYELHEDEPAP
jgi:hypothetical protein